MISKEDYLKKYLSSTNEKKKSKKSKRSKEVEKPRMKIIDVDAIVPIESMPESKIVDKESREEMEPEENPVVVLAGTGADELKMIGKFQSSNWKNLEDSKKNGKKSENQTRRRHDSDLGDDDEINNSRRKESNSNMVRRRHDSDSDGQCSSKDLSPPRHRKTSDIRADDLSPPRKKRPERLDSGSDSDSHVKRRKANRNQSSDLSPLRRGNTDLSPPRRTIKTEPDSDSSPPRRAVKTIKTELDSDSSPPRRNVKTEPDSDSSPPRKSKRRRSGSSSPTSRQTAERKDKIKLTLSGAKSGLQNAKELRKEMKTLKRREDEIFEKYGDEATGRNAETIVRRKMVPSSKKKKELTEEEKRRIAELEEKYKVWNKGVKQVKEREEKLKEMAEIVDKPLARYADDKDLELHLKDQMLSDDPMLNYMMDKRVKEGKRTINAHVYRGPPAPPNRYKILPGYRWDGVDRSNGFEKTLLSQGNLKKAEEEEYYQWSSGRFE